MKKLTIFGAVAILAASSTIAHARSPVHRPLPPNPNTAKVLQAFPPAQPGQMRFVIPLPPQADEQAYRVGIRVGRVQQTDGVNQYGLSGELVETVLSGWGYTYYEYTGRLDQGYSTRMAPRPGRPPVQAFVSSPESVVRYNSRMPLVIYAPAGAEVRYRIYAAGPEQSAQSMDGAASGQSYGSNSGMAPMPPSHPNPYSPDHHSQGYPSQANPAGPSTQSQPPASISQGQPSIQSSQAPNSQAAGGAGMAVLNFSGAVTLPSGAIASVDLYDSMLMDTNSTYASNKTKINQLPARIYLPKANNSGRIVGPAVSVRISDQNGHLLYLNDTVTPINPNGETQINLIKVG